jgi:serine protease Do
VILAVNDRQVTSVGEFRTAVEGSGGTVALLIQRNGAKIFIPVRADS